jgi:hypothetical protein
MKRKNTKHQYRILRHVSRVMTHVSQSSLDDWNHLNLDSFCLLTLDDQPPKRSDDSSRGATVPMANDEVERITKSKQQAATRNRICFFMMKPKASAGCD